PGGEVAPTLDQAAELLGEPAQEHERRHPDRHPGGAEGAPHRAAAHVVQREHGRARLVEPTESQRKTAASGCRARPWLPRTLPPHVARNRRQGRDRSEVTQNDAPCLRLDNLARRSPTTRSGSISPFARAEAGGSGRLRL